MRRSAQLADELQRRRADLIVGCGRIEVGECSNVPAHVQKSPACPAVAEGEGGPYWYRNTTSGFTRVARRAGMSAATSATTASTIVTITSVAGSVGDTW